MALEACILYHDLNRIYVQSSSLPFFPLFYLVLTFFGFVFLFIFSQFAKDMNLTISWPLECWTGNILVTPCSLILPHSSWLTRMNVKLLTHRHDYRKKRTYHFIVMNIIVHKNNILNIEHWKSLILLCVYVSV